MRVRRLGAAFSALFGLVVIAACGEPYDGAASPSPDAAADGAASDGAASDGAASDGADHVDSGAPDASGDVTTIDGAPVDASCDPCDCDGDGYVLDDGAKCPDARGKARDCDDLDSRAHPAAGFRADQPAATTAGDWDCSGVVTREVAAVSVDCPSLPATSCAGVEGFATNPGCGESGAYITCVSMGGSCIAGSFAQRVQRCK